jgi:hypothetical protein
MKKTYFYKGIALATMAVAVTMIPTSVGAFGYGGGGGGGGWVCQSPFNPPPGGFKFRFMKANREVTAVTDPDVDLQIDGNSDVDRMAISNDPSFTNAGSEVFAPTKRWRLPNGFGRKIVWIKLYDRCGMPRVTFSGSVDYQNGTITQIPGTGRVLGEKITALDELIAKLKYNDRGDEVVSLQDQLKEAGYFSKSVKSTGWYGPITQRAVNAYLAKTKAGTVTVADDADLQTLASTLKYNDRGDAVKSLQTQLRALGFFPSYVRSTGWYGPITQGAVAKYLAAKK